MRISNPTFLVLQERFSRISSLAHAAQSNRFAITAVELSFLAVVVFLLGHNLKVGGRQDQPFARITAVGSTVRWGTGFVRKNKIGFDIPGPKLVVVDGCMLSFSHDDPKPTDRQDNKILASLA